MSMKRFLGIALVAATCAAGAQAATTQQWINLKGRGGVDDSFSYSAGNVGLTVSAYNHANGVLGSKASVVKRKMGLGVKSAGERGSNIDGRGKDEMLVLQFDRDVRIKKIVFASVDGKDQFVLSSYNSDVLQKLNDSLGIKGKGRRGVSQLTRGQRLTGDMFGIGAVEGNDQFRIKRIKVAYADDISGGGATGGTSEAGAPAKAPGKTGQGKPVSNDTAAAAKPPVTKPSKPVVVPQVVPAVVVVPPVDVTPVPVPAGGVLLLSGLAALGIARRRRKA